MKIHDIFHTFLLRKVAIDSFIKQIQSSSSSIMINEQNEKKYEIDDILNNRYHYEKLQYKVVWTNHSSNKAWYLKQNFQEHLKEILNDYHRRYSNKFDSNLRLIATIEALLSQWIRNEHKKTKQLIQDMLNKMKAKMKKMIECDQNKVRLLIFSIDTKRRKYVWIRLKNSNSLKFWFKIFNQNEIII
jgi:ribosomal protein S17E